ncbi:MAG TPA: ATP-binding cassette domain-containing protein [Capillimicrobium sp.]|nr:ATP-binding cassette domain-containing protein [Capillimicrobium sp.]
MSSHTAPPALEGRRLAKRFGDVVALDDVTIALRPGDVHAVVGENGAGKSTLARLLAGELGADAGDVRAAGAPLRAGSRRAALAAGVAIVPQALSLVGDLSLAEHVALDAGPGRFDAAAATRAVDAALARLGAAVDTATPTARMTLPERQLGELAVALALGARVLILDEPTSSLGPAEVEALVEAIRGLAADGVAVLLVTHRIREALAAASAITVLRGGRLVHQGSTEGLDAEAIAEHMVGRLEAPQARPARPLGPVRLAVEGVAAGAGPGALHGVTLAVAGGEVVGVAGVAGSGQRALAETVAGVIAPDQGRVLVDGADVTGAPARAAAAGVAYVPEDRAEGVVAARSGVENAVLLRTLRERGLRTRLGVRHRRAERSVADKVYERFDVRPRRPALRAGTLSGGNQQKLLVGRELDRQPAVVVAHGPTQGLDLRAAAAIRGDLTAAAEHGAAVLVLSADLDEVLALADRVVVLSEGRITDELRSRDDVDATRIGTAMAGAARQKELAA